LTRAWQTSLCDSRRPIPTGGCRSRPGGGVARWPHTEDAGHGPRDYISDHPVCAHRGGPPAPPTRSRWSSRTSGRPHAIRLAEFREAAGWPSGRGAGRRRSGRSPPTPPQTRSDLVEGLSLGSAAQAEVGVGIIRVTMTDPSNSPGVADPHARSPIRSTS